MAIVSVYARSPHRIVVSMNPAPTTTTADYVLERKDGAGTLARPTLVWLTNGNTAEIALSEAMLSDVVYQLVYQAGTPIDLIYKDAQLPVDGPSATEDLETEVLGLDVDWMASELTASGDLPDIKGRDCFRLDLVAAAFIQPGELTHKPQEGAGAPRFVNGPGIAEKKRQLQGDLLKQWLRDPRTSQDGTELEVSINGYGEVDIKAEVGVAADDSVLSIEVTGDDNAPTGHETWPGTL